MLGKHPREEPVGGDGVAPSGDEHVEDLAMLVDGPVDVAPHPCDLDVGALVRWAAVEAISRLHDGTVIEDHY